MAAAKSQVLPGERPVVLVIDFIRSFTDTVSPLASDYTAQVTAARQLLDAARAKGIPIIFSSEKYQKNMKDTGIWSQKIKGKEIQTQETFSYIDERLGYREEEIIIYKKGASVFSNTGILSILNELHADTILLCGCTSSGCVRGSAVDAWQNGYHVVAISECIGDRAQAPHEATLFDIGRNYGQLASLEEIITAIHSL